MHKDGIVRQRKYDKWSKDSRVYGLCVDKDTLRNLLKNSWSWRCRHKFPLWSHLANTITLPWRKNVLLSIICSLLIIVWTRKGIWKAVSLKWECPTRAKHYTYIFLTGTTKCKLEEQVKSSFKQCSFPRIHCRWCCSFLVLSLQSFSMLRATPEIPMVHTHEQWDASQSHLD